jgi:hypothetical protein
MSDSPTQGRMEELAKQHQWPGERFCQRIILVFYYYFFKKK